MQQPLELLELRLAGQAEQRCRLAAPFAAQLVAVEIVAAVRLAEIMRPPCPASLPLIGFIPSIGDTPWTTKM